MSHVLPHPQSDPVHRFHIPVMGTGFTIDTPLKVARYGISSVVSLVDDVLIEQVRRRLADLAGTPCTPIADGEDDARARRITAYLDLMHDAVQDQVARLRAAAFTAGSELSRYYELLPDSPLRSLYEKMLAAADPDERARLQEELRARVVPGGIDVNIMTKLDRAQLRGGQALGPLFSDALSALRGYANSKVRSSLVLSAGLNRRLFSYLREFTDFLPDDGGDLKKRIVLKVSDFRSAMVQGKLLARDGLWVSEFRVESGLNCGGHAFGGAGALLGPILEEFARERAGLTDQLYTMWRGGLEKLGRPVPSDPPPLRITVQGGLGTAEETELLRRRYGVDGVGWGSPFLTVPEVVNIDAENLARVLAAGEDDVQLSQGSPLGVPFWSLRDSVSEKARRRRIAEGHPGSACPKGYLVANTEFTRAPICTASRAYQRRALQQLAATDLDDTVRADRTEAITAKACICHDLAGSATVPMGIDPDATTAICCGPNTVYFKQATGLKEMVDHIYGRATLPLAAGRPHMLLKELSLHLDRLRGELERRRRGLAEDGSRPAEIRANLAAGIVHYRELAEQLVRGQREEFTARLEKLRADLDAIGFAAKIVSGPVPAPGPACSDPFSTAPTGTRLSAPTRTAVASGQASSGDR
ncbi:MAG: hypothetical protein R6X35_10490 [Candidatus Krumholzibacteriia bacterium]